LFLAGLGPAATACCSWPEPAAQQPSPDVQAAVETLVRERAGQTRDLLVRELLWKDAANEAGRTPGDVWQAPGMKTLREELVRLLEPWVALPPGVTWDEGAGKKALDTVAEIGLLLSGGLASYQVHGVGPDAKMPPGTVGVVLEVADTLQKRTSTYELHLKKIGKTWKVVGAAASIAPNRPSASGTLRPGARSSRAAAPWLDAVLHLDARPVEADLTVVANPASQGTRFAVNGRFSLADATHYRLESRMKISGGAVPDEIAGKEMPLLAVADGSTFWLQRQGPSKGVQVAKTPLDFLEQSAAGNPSSAGGFRWIGNPFDVVAWYAGTVGFQLVREAGDSVKLRGFSYEPGPAGKNGGNAREVMDVVLILDKKTHYPRKLEVEVDGRPLGAMVFSNYRFPKELDPALFAYQVPQGAAVDNLGEMPGVEEESPPSGGGF